MSIQTQIERLTGAKTALKTAIEQKGVDVPEDAPLEQYAPLVEQIAGGSAFEEKIVSEFTLEEETTEVLQDITDYEALNEADEIFVVGRINRAVTESDGLGSLTLGTYRNQLWFKFMNNVAKTVPSTSVSYVGYTAPKVFFHRIPQSGNYFFGKYVVQVQNQGNVVNNTDLGMTFSSADRFYVKATNYMGAGTTFKLMTRRYING